MVLSPHSSIILGQTDKARIEMDVTGDQGVVRPVGTIDEDINFGTVIDAMGLLGVTLKRLVFDLGRVDRINSGGVREWLLLLERLPQSTEYAFANVNQLMIEQASVIPGIVGRKGLAVLSFHAPYFCAQCKKEFSILLEPTQVIMRDDVPAAPAQKCPDCSSELQFDWIEEEYLAFLKRSGRGNQS